MVKLEGVENKITTERDCHKDITKCFVLNLRS